MRRDLGALGAREHDLLVVGGGIYGAAAAWDAGQRGLSVALVERDDFAAGASANSLKTIHGGLRHLQGADLASFRESVRERRALLRIAPALVRPLAFVAPTRGHGLSGRLAFRGALAVNDLLSADRNRGVPADRQVAGGRLLSRPEIEALVPGLPPARLTGGALWHDAQVESGERLAVAFVRAATEVGAAVANHAEALSLIVEDGRVKGARVRDPLTAEKLPVRAKMVLNAAGPGMADLLAASGLASPPAPLLRARNIVFSTPLPTAVAVGEKSRGRYLFLVPWRGRTLAGTSYEPAGAAHKNAVRSFLEELQAVFPWADLQARNVALVHEGLVPGRGGSGGLARSPILRDHESADGLAGLVSIQGVKYTTARGVAERGVSLVLRRLGRRAVCRTAETPLVHARPLEGSLEERTRAAVQDEMAITLGDAVRRRLDLGTAGPAPPAEVAAVEGVMASLLGWDDERRRAEREALAGVYASALLE